MKSRYIIFESNARFNRLILFLRLGNILDYKQLYANVATNPLPY